MARLWYGSKWLRIGGVMLLLGLAVVLAIPFLISADRFRPLLVQLIESKTGHQIQIDALRLYLVPTVHLHAMNVRMKNPRGFPGDDAIIVKVIDFGVAPRALLSRRLEVTYIAFRGARVTVIRDPTGRTNLAPSPPWSAPPGSTAAAARGAPFLSLGRVGAITVANMEITFADVAPRQARVVPFLNLSGLSATLRPINPDAAGWPRGLDIVADLRGARVTTPSLAKPVQFQAGAFHVRNGAGEGTFSVSLDTLRATGSVQIASFDPLSLTFAVAVPELNVDRLKTMVRSRASGRANIRTPSARHLLARGGVKIDRLIVSPVEATRMSGRVSVYTDTIRLDSFTLSAYDGTIQGAAALDYFVAGSPAAVTATARGVNLGRVLSTLAPQARTITGSLDADLRLLTTLGRDPKAALTGAGTFAVRNGSFPGLDLKSGLGQLARALQSNVPAGDTRFSYFGGDFRIAQERVYSTSLRLDADGLAATGRGSSGFNNTLDYAGTGTLTTLASGAPASGGLLSSVEQSLANVLPGVRGSTGARVAFLLRGTFDAPKFSLAGIPQLNQSPGLNQQPQQQLQLPKQPFPQDLFKLFQ
jgi:uncharacterized protein involved in outer membrane biogenesis